LHNHHGTSLLILIVIIFHHANAFLAFIMMKDLTSMPPEQLKTDKMAKLLS